MVAAATEIKQRSNEQTGGDETVREKEQLGEPESATQAAGGSDVRIKSSLRQQRP